MEASPPCRPRILAPVGRDLFSNKLSNTAGNFSMHGKSRAPPPSAGFGLEWLYCAVVFFHKEPLRVELEITAQHDPGVCGRGGRGCSALWGIRKAAAITLRRECPPPPPALLRCIFPAAASFESIKSRQHLADRRLFCTVTFFPQIPLK